MKDNLASSNTLLILILLILVFEFHAAWTGQVKIKIKAIWPGKEMGEKKGKDQIRKKKIVWFMLHYKTNSWILSYIIWKE